MSEYEVIEEEEEQELGEEVTILASPSSQLIEQLVSAVEVLGKTKVQLRQLIEVAREMQQELARRGIRMDFDELNAPIVGSTEIHTVGAITPGPGITQPIPEPEEELDIDVPELEIPVERQDVRSVAQIRRDATPPPNSQDAANFAEQAGLDHMRAIEQGMREAARLQKKSEQL